jgi:hypothetical protein
MFHHFFVILSNQGIDCGAEPIGQLRDKLVSLLGPAAIKEEKSSKLSAKNALRSKTLTYFDNGEVQFNKKVSNDGYWYYQQLC